MDERIPGLRLGFFPALKGADSVLLHGNAQQINSLVPRLYGFLASSVQEWPLHEHTLVSRRCPARLYVSRLGPSNHSGYRWRCSPADLPAIQAMFQALTAAGTGHRTFALEGSPVRLIVSAGEYPEDWWRQNA